MKKFLRLDLEGMEQVHEMYLTGTRTYTDSVHIVDELLLEKVSSQQLQKCIVDQLAIEVQDHKDARYEFAQSVWMNEHDGEPYIEYDDDDWSDSEVFDLPIAYAPDAVEEYFQRTGLHYDIVNNCVIDAPVTNSDISSDNESDSEDQDSISFVCDTCSNEYDTNNCDIEDIGSVMDDSSDDDWTPKVDEYTYTLISMISNCLPPQYNLNCKPDDSLPHASTCRITPGDLCMFLFRDDDPPDIKVWDHILVDLDYPLKNKHCVGVDIARTTCGLIHPLFGTSCCSYDIDGYHIAVCIHNGRLLANRLDYPIYYYTCYDDGEYHTDFPLSTAAHRIAFISEPTDKCYRLRCHGFSFRAQFDTVPRLPSVYYSNDTEIMIKDSPPIVVDVPDNVDGVSPLDFLTTSGTTMYRSIYEYFSPFNISYFQGVLRDYRH